MISVLCPTRKRHVWLTRMVDSLFDTASGPVEVCLYIDDDDPGSVVTAKMLARLYGPHKIKWMVGPRIVMSEYWNKLVSIAAGEYFMLGNDDVVYETPDWDEYVDYFFSFLPDKIAHVYGSDDGQHYEGFGAHGIVHRRWVETLGYFVPPYFTSDHGDAFLNEVASALDRNRYLPFTVKHYHFMFGNAPIDDTYRDRLERHYKDRNAEKWVATAAERTRDIAKLRALLGTSYPVAVSA